MEDNRRTRRAPGEAKGGEGGGMSVSQRLEALRTKRDGPRVSFGGTRDDAPKQEAPDRSAEERPMNADAKTLREDDSADELTRLRTRLKESRQTFRDARGDQRPGTPETRRRGRGGKDDDKEDDEDEDEEEASVAMVYLPRPQKPFGELGLIQPIQPSESPIVALEGPKPPDQLKVIYVPSWDVTAQVKDAFGRLVDAIKKRPWRFGEAAGSAGPNGAIQTDDEEWLLQEVGGPNEEEEAAAAAAADVASRGAVTWGQDGLYVDEKAVVVSRFVSRRRLVSRVFRDTTVQRLERSERKAWRAISREGRRRRGSGDGKEGVEDDDDEEDEEEELKEEPPSLGLEAGLVPNPVQDSLSRPHTVLTEDAGRPKPVPPHLQLHVIRPVQQGLIGVADGGDSSSLSSSSHLRHEAAIHIVLSRITLYDHPLFRHEDELLAQLRLMFADYRRRLEENSAPHLTSRLAALSSEIARRKALSSSGGEQQGGESLERLESCRQLFDDAIESVMALLLSEQGFRQLGRAVYAKWKDVERERARTGYKSTAARLVAFEVEHPAVSSLEAVLAELRQGLQWLAGEIGAMWERNRQVYEAQMNDIEASTYAEVDWEAEAARAQDVLESCRFIFPRDDQPDYVLKLLGDDMSYRDETAVPASELQRRDELQKIKYYARILMNGQVISETSARALDWPRFSLSFNKSVHLWLLRRPQSLAIHLMRKRLLLDEHVATILVPVPGQTPDFDRGNTHGIAPKADWYQFSASEVMGTGKLATRRITGAALVGIEWEPTLPFSESRDPPRLPARSRPPTTNRMQGLRSEELAQNLSREGEEGSSRAARQPLPDFEREKDFLQMLPNLSLIDPNDPRNANLLRFREMVLPSGDVLYSRFRTVEHCFQLCFATPQGLLIDYRRFEGPRRHDLIRLRRRRPDAFIAPIPLSETEIRLDEGYQELLEEEKKKRDDAELEDAGDARKTVDKAKLRDFVRRVRESRGAMDRKKKKKKVPLASVVQEDLMPDMQPGYLIDLSQFLPAPRRSLRPAPKVRTPVNVNVSACRLLIQVVLARNVPARKFEKKAETADMSKMKQTASSRRGRGGTTRRKGSDVDEDDAKNVRDEEDEDEDERRSKAETTKVQSFVEVRFQDQLAKTKVAEGRTPIWKDSIQLPFTPPMNDFSAAALSQIRDTVTLSLFDLIRIDDRPSGGYYADENTVRTEKRFLGSLTIPFTTIYMEGRVDGVFRLDTPLVNLGYQQVSLDPSSSSSSSGADGAQLGQTARGGMASGANLAEALLRDSETSSYISVMATLDPLLLTPVKDDNDLLDVTEERSFVKYASVWLERARQATAFNPRRHFRLFVPKLDGERVFISRYLRAQAPPPGLTTVRQCVRFVSLLPFLEDWQTFVGEGDIWCTTQQFLDILAGDFEEHAVLLHNLLLHLSLQDQQQHENEAGGGGGRVDVFLVLAQGIPEGDTTYVMWRRGGARGDIVFWNPCTGLGFSSHDERCPLQDIGMLVGVNNVYANLQAAGPPSKLSFDLDNPKHWQPFYTRAFPAPEPGAMVSVQSASLTYTPTSKGFVLELEEQLMDSLKRYIRRWRARRATTSFNAEVSSRLNDLLPTLEKVKQGEAFFSAEDHEKKLAPVLRQRGLFGMPLNMPFTEIGDVIQRVKATGTHETKNPDAQFALAVSIFPYTNNVLSVWVYFAYTVPRMNVIK